MKIKKLNDTILNVIFCKLWLNKIFLNFEFLYFEIFAFRNLIFKLIYINRFI